MVNKIKIYKNFKILRKHQNAMILIGNFDGLHLGHQRLFKEAKKYKKKYNSKIGVVTFDPIPKMYFDKSITNYRLSNLNQKSRYFSDYNVDFLINKKFDKKFSKISCHNFIKNILCKKLSADYIFVSNNFRFGNNREGNVNLLIENEKTYNYKVVKELIDKIKAKSLGKDVLNSISPAEQFIKIFNDELTLLLGDKSSDLNIKVKPPAVIMIIGLQGSGKTTTLYAGLRDLSDSSQNILTVEDPIEYTLKGIGQTQVNQKTGYSFATGLRAMLRQDPDVVMVGEIRDTETAQIAIQASLTGHLVLSTVHTNSAVGAITRLRDMGIESFLISSSLKTVISQRLVRRLCDSCKVKTTINKDIADLFGLKHNLEVYDHKGCDKCNGTGYKGRIAVAECVNVDKTIKDMIHNEKSENEINEYVFKNAPSINSSCSDLLIKGITSCDELIRSNNIKEDAFV